MSEAADLRTQLAQLETERIQLDNEQEREKSFSKSKGYKWTKTAIIIIVVYITLIGTFGSMHFWLFKNFSMIDFTSFLGSFSPIFITLTGGISIGGIAKNIAKGLANNNTATENSSIAAGENLARSGE